MGHDHGQKQWQEQDHEHGDAAGPGSSSTLGLGQAQDLKDNITEGASCSPSKSLRKTRPSDRNKRREVRSTANNTKTAMSVASIDNKLG